MREIENLAELVPAAKATARAAKNIVKLPCMHTGGILPPNECI